MKHPQLKFDQLVISALALFLTVLFGLYVLPAPGTASAKMDAKAMHGLQVYNEAYSFFRDQHRMLRDRAAREKFASMWEHKHDNDPTLGTEDGLNHAINEMIWSLDQPYDYYYAVKGSSLRRSKREGTVSGIGASFSQKGVVEGIQALKNSGSKVRSEALEELLKIADERPLWVAREPRADEPAARAGLKKGDRILAVDGHPVKGMTAGHVVNDLIQGPVDTTVKLTVARDGSPAPLDVVIVRAKLRTHVVDSTSLPDGLTMIALQNFDSQYSDEELAEAIKAAVAGGGKGIVLDLRSNPGGDLYKVLAIAQMFIREGKVAELILRDGDEEITMIFSLTPDNIVVSRTSSDPSKKPETEIGPRDYPVLVPQNYAVAVLISGASASGAEMLSGALQVNHLATIIGTPSRGKGVGQVLHWIDNERRLIEATNLEFRPGGLASDGVGIIPDVEVALPDGVDIFASPELDTQLNEARKQALAIASGQKPPLRPASEIIARREELKQLHADDFAQEQMMRKAILDGDFIPDDQ
ncbi:MAG: PDZ domain-containing protein [Cyanobacteria bacterium SZAS TMP-1]|nr:PDZ domain-containing protein [Cyanobacteria bacterium SZAS TMP-1]